MSQFISVQGGIRAALSQGLFVGCSVLPLYNSCCFERWIFSTGKLIIQSCLIMNHLVSWIVLSLIQIGIFQLDLPEGDNYFWNICLANDYICLLMCPLPLAPCIFLLMVVGQVIRGHDGWLSWELDPGNWKLLTLSLFPRMYIPPTVPIARAISRTYSRESKLSWMVCKTEHH